MKHIVGQASRLPARGAPASCRRVARLCVEKLADRMPAVPPFGRFAARAGETPALRWRRAGSARQCAENVRRILSRIIRFGFAACAGLAVLLPASAAACASCFGQSDSPMAKGMNAGIFALLLVITSVLLVIAIFFAYILRRAARLNEAATAPDAASLATASSPVSQPTH
ncbi:MAG TPA: hypothetical protein VFT34_19195 [Verrucomicrobiae bacterium]|nr:hypothetical protein [Verrucomicrobiae bacterium]